MTKADELVYPIRGRRPRLDAKFGVAASMSEAERDAMRLGEDFQSVDAAAPRPAPRVRTQHLDVAQALPHRATGPTPPGINW